MTFVFIGTVAINILYFGFQAGLGLAEVSIVNKKQKERDE